MQYTQDEIKEMVWQAIQDIRISTVVGLQFIEEGKLTPDRATFLFNDIQAKIDFYMEHSQ